MRSGTIAHIQIIYSKNLLSKAEIKTTDIYLKPEFYFKSDYLYFAWSKTDINKLSQKFSYDKYKNVTEIKYFINDVYKYSKLFIYDYY